MAGSDRARCGAISRSRTVICADNCDCYMKGSVNSDGIVHYDSDCGDCDCESIALSVHIPPR